MIASVRGRTGLPFNAFETGAWLSFDSLIKRLTPMSDYLFLPRRIGNYQFCPLFKNVDIGINHARIFALRRKKRRAELPKMNKDGSLRRAREAESP
jgi:hypothetical protein